MLHSRHPGVLLDISGIRNVQELISLGTDEVSNGALHVLRPDLLGAYPLRRVIRSILLIERRTMDAVRKTLENQRPIQQMRNQIRRDLVVVVDQIAFGVAVLRPEYL